MSDGPKDAGAPKANLGNAKKSERISDLDIWRSANLLIKQHGEQAWTEAVARYVELQKQGDQEGMDVWRRIAKAIDEFTSRVATSALN